MRIAVSTRQEACERLLHFHPKKTIARELGISHGSVRDWSILIDSGNFEWVNTNYSKRREELLNEAVEYWLDQYPIGYSDVARKYGIRPAALYQSIGRRLAKLPQSLLPAKVRFWEPAPSPEIGEFKMEIEKLSDIPGDRALTLSERKALLKELKLAKDRLICAESLLEVAVESCDDELKK